MLNNALHDRYARSLGDLVHLNFDEGFEMRASKEQVEAALSAIAEYHLLDFKGDYPLFEIDLAIDRLRNGTYGICLTCRAEIEAVILEQNPLARVCKKCFDMWRKFQ